MSASRPAKGRIVPRQRAVPLAQAASSSKSTPKSTPAPRAMETGGRKAKPTLADKIQTLQNPTTSSVKGKEKAKAAPPPRQVSEPEDEDGESEDDEFEEVPIPEAGPSTPGPGTPTTPGTNFTRATGTPGTAGTVTTAPSVDEEYAGYDDEEDEEQDGEQDDQVLTLKLDGETPEARAKRIALALRKKPMTSKDRAIRLEVHKFHVIALLASTRIRNKWCCDSLLKARLLSLLPHPLHSAFNIPPSRFPDRAQRSRLFFDALQSLVAWWSQTFFDISDSTLGLRTRTWDEVQEVVDKLPKLTRGDIYPNSFEAPSDWSEAMETLEEGSGGEKLRSVNSLMKKALQQEGSRDVSAQLFVSLARALGLGTRLVVSLQPTPWRAEKVVPKKKSGAGKGGKSIASRQGDGDTEGSDEELEEVPIPDGGANGAPGEVVQKIKQKPIRGAGRRRHHDPADMYRLRKPVAQKLGTAPKPKRKKEDLSHQPPVFWAEVFSRSDQRWIPVDPVLGLVRKKAHYEPSSESGPVRMLYVVAFEEDGHARDVTLRYTKNFGAKTIKLRPPARKDEPDWWGSVTGFLERPYRLNRDELEDAELETSQVSEGMPMHMSGFKDHPIYVLERHLKREEVIQPKKEIGRFRGEPVFRRANVHSCKTAENWMRSGRKVKPKEEPMKWVKQRAVTLEKRRAQELSKQESGEDIQQGLYAEWQTEIFRPPPINDGKIPQNSFGNIDLYAPTMLPAGAVHLPYKGIAKVAKSLQISYAEACTGFEFKKRRAIPVITGIVVAAENEVLVMDAYEESAAAAEERERAKKVERALKRWAKLVNGLRVRARLQAEYGAGDELQHDSHNPLADAPDATPSKATKSAAAVIASAHQQAGDQWARKVRENSISEEIEEVKGDGESPLARDYALVEASERPASPAPAAHDPVEVDTAPSPVPVQVEPKPTQSSAAKRTIIRIPRQSASNTLSRPVRAAQNAKRRAATPDESDAATSTSETAPPASRKRAKKPTAPAAPAPVSTRTLRSRTSKTQEQMQEEEETKKRLKEALASEDEVTDVSE